MEVKIPGVQLLRKRSDRGDLISKRRSEFKSTSGLSKKPKFSQCQKVRSIYFIDPSGEEFQEIIKNTRRKLEVPMPVAMPCRSRREEYRETCRFRKMVRHNTHASHEKAYGRTSS